MVLKVLHTADWHLGKRLERFNRINEQAQVLQEISEVAERENADLVLVAGDLFDTFNPSVEAIELFYKTLKRLAKNGERPVIAIAGNHDSPERINAPDPLARECGIIFIGFPNVKVPPFEIPNKFAITNSDEGFIELKLDKFSYPVRILHTAYANEVRLQKELDKDNQGSALNEILHSHWKKLADQYCDHQGVNLLVSHLYMSDKNGEILEEPDGEKPLKIGNADLLYSNIVPPQIQYTALGHLHRFHQLGKPDTPVVYSGSPLSYSFSEAGQQKYVVLLNAEPFKSVDYQFIELKKGYPLSRKKFSSVDQAIHWLTNNPDHLVELTLVSNTFLQADDIKRLNKAHDKIVMIIPQITLERENREETNNQVNLNQDIKGLFTDYFKQKYAGQLPNEDILNLFDEVLNGNNLK